MTELCFQPSSHQSFHIAMCLRVLRDALLQARGLWLEQIRHDDHHLFAKLKAATLFSVRKHTFKINSEYIGCSKFCSWEQNLEIKRLQAFQSWLASKMEYHTGQRYSDVVGYIRKRLRSEILRTAVISLRGDRSARLLLLCRN